jgi:zinc transport system permease protein
VVEVELLSFEFMQRALLAALLVGLTAPAVGTFLVQRRLALVGDGIGHVALTGVAVGLLTATSPVWTALVAAVAGAVVIELMRRGGRTGGDVALAVLFYGGIAGGVVLIALSPDGGSANLAGYLFGSLTTTTSADVVAFAVLAVVVLGCVLVLGQRMFAVSNDEEFARASGLPVLALNVLLAVLTAVTVVVSMRVVGLLLVSALMIVPNAVAQQVSRTFRSTVVIAVVVGLVSSLGGAVLSFYADTPSGGTIVLLAIALFLVVAVGSQVARRVGSRTRPRVGYHPHEHGEDCGHDAVPHDDHVDYLHDGHRHAGHAGHYHEHPSRRAALADGDETGERAGAATTGGER